MKPGSQLVVIPVFNEERHIAAVLCELKKWHNDEVLVVNDGSTDRTAEILGQHCGKSLNVITHGANKGYGAALMAGFNFAIDNGFNAVVTMDADWQHQPSKVPSFFSDLLLADIVSGSRYLAESLDNNDAPGARREINAEITKLINAATGYKLTDGFCGFKALRVEPLKKLLLTEMGYAFPLQFWIQAARFGLSLREISVKRIYNDLTRSFGSQQLDDPQIRRAHYRSVIEKEISRWAYVE